MTAMVLGIVSLCGMCLCPWWESLAESWLRYSASWAITPKAAAWRLPASRWEAWASCRASRLCLSLLDRPCFAISGLHEERVANVPCHHHLSAVPQPAQFPPESSGKLVRCPACKATFSLKLGEGGSLPVEPWPPPAPASPTSVPAPSLAPWTPAGANAAAEVHASRSPDRWDDDDDVGPATGAVFAATMTRTATNRWKDCSGAGTAT